MNRFGWHAVIFRIAGWNIPLKKEIMKMNCVEFLDNLSMEIEIEDYKEEIMKKQQNRLH